MPKEYSQPRIFPPMAAAEATFLVIEDFEAEHHYVFGGTSGKYNVYRMGGAARAGNYGLVIYISAASYSVGDNAYIRQYIGIGAATELCVEALIEPRNIDGQPTIDFTLQTPTLEDGYRSYAAVRIHTGNNKVYVQTSGGAWQEVGTLRAFGTDRWTRIYFEVDKINEKYKRLVIDDQEFDVSNIDTYQTTTLDNTKLYQIKGTSTVADAFEFYVDHVIIRSAAV